VALEPGKSAQRVGRSVLGCAALLVGRTSPCLSDVTKRFLAGPFPGGHRSYVRLGITFGSVVLHLVQRLFQATFQVGSLPHYLVFDGPIHNLGHGLTGLLGEMLQRRFGAPVFESQREHAAASRSIHAFYRRLPPP